MAAPEYEAYYKVIRRIPRGRVMTYGDVAIAAGFPGRARRVGYALHGLRDARVPWWRVVNAQGGISIGSGRGDGADRQRDHLEAEGVELLGEGRLRLDDYRYVPPAFRSVGAKGAAAKRRGGP